ncbi:MAG: alpha-ketoacid dehydrogenase subunit beta [Actinobacteria bacterium]|nr:alpha-ketoacid dehydrogenase subunit beta [Actinomycetota bacterium]
MHDNVKIREITYIEAIREAMQQMMRIDSDVYLMGEDVAEYGGIFSVSVGMVQEFGKERIRNTPISEEAIVGAAAGSALTGMRPIAEIMFIDFITIAMDEIINQAAKIRYMFGKQAKVPLVIRTAAGGGLGHAAQHSQSLEALLTHIPGIKVVMPSCPYDAKGLLISSIRDNNPVIFIEHKLLYRNKKYAQNVPEEIYEIPLGVGDVKRTGKDLSIVATSFMVQKSLEVAEELKNEEGIDCEVIDLRTLRPLDINIVLGSIKKTGKLICVQEACGFGGFMGEVITQVVEKGFNLLKAPIARVTGKDCPVPCSIVLEQEMIPSIDRIKKGILEILQKT